jgi:hypothetical protein
MIMSPGGSGARLRSKIKIMKVGLLRKNGYELRWFFVACFIDVVDPEKLLSSSRQFWMSFRKACSGSEIKVSGIAFGEVSASPKVETVLFRRLSVQLSLGGVLSSRARLCFTGQKQCAPLAALNHSKKALV